MIVKILVVGNGAHLLPRIGETGAQSLNDQRIDFMACIFPHCGIKNTIIVYPFVSKRFVNHQTAKEKNV